MRTISWSTQFKKDYKKVKNPTIDTTLNEIAILLARDIPLEAKYKDHALIGTWRGYRECHLKPDLLLIYKQRGRRVKTCKARLSF